MIQTLRYSKYLAKHKYFVFVAGRKTDVPLWRLLIHDWSKFTPAEWGPYKRRFFTDQRGSLDKSRDPFEFHKAWTHHWHLNAHHWEHWLTVEGVPMEMPDVYVREMVADWAGAGRAITGKWDVRQWYEANQDRLRLAPSTRQRVISLLGYLP